MFSMCAMIARSRLQTTFMLELARNSKPVTEITTFLPFKFLNQSSRCRPIPPTVRWLGTTRDLLKKDGAGKDGEIPSHKLLMPGVEPVHERKDTKENAAGIKDKKMIIVNPPTVQVFADPNMAQTVRDVAVNIEKIKCQLKFLREEFSESSFEVLKLSQGRSSILAALKETRKFCLDNQSVLASLKSEQKKMDQLLVYISKMVARHENQLNDAKKGRDRDAVTKKMDGILQRIDQANGRIKNLTSNNDNLQIDMTKALVDVKQLRNDVNRLELEIKFRGKQISELKGKSPNR